MRRLNGWNNPAKQKNNQVVLSHVEATLFSSFFLRFFLRSLLCSSRFFASPSERTPAKARKACRRASFVMTSLSFLGVLFLQPVIHMLLGLLIKFFLIIVKRIHMLVFKESFLFSAYRSGFSSRCIFSTARYMRVGTSLQSG